MLLQKQKHKRNKAWLLLKNGTYKLPHELPNDLRLSILGNQDMSEKSQNFIEL